MGDQGVQVPQMNIVHCGIMAKFIGFADGRYRTPYGTVVAAS